MRRFKWKTHVEGIGSRQVGARALGFAGFHENCNCLKNTLAVGEYLMGCVFFLKTLTQGVEKPLRSHWGDYSTKS